MVAREHKKPKTCFVQVLKCQGDLELKNICLWNVDKTFNEIGSILESFYFEGSEDALEEALFLNLCYLAVEARGISSGSKIGINWSAFEALLKRLDLPGIDCHCGPGEKCDWESASALKERPKVFGEY